MAKLPKIRGKIPKDRNKIQKMRRNKEARRHFGREFLRRSTGLDANEDFGQDSFVYKKLGLFGKQARRSANDDVPDVPSLATPKRVPNEANPSLSSIIKQLSALLKTASKIGLLNKKQQEALVSQIEQAKRVAKEQQMETPVTPAPEAVQGMGEDIGPGQDIVKQLVEELAKLTDAVQEKLQEQEDVQTPRSFTELFMDRRGLDIRQVRDERAATLRERFVDSIGPDDLRDKRGRRLTGAARTSRRDKLIRDYDKARAVRKPNVASRAISKTTNSVASLIGRGASKASGQVAKKALGKAAIKKMAMPIILKGLGKTALKSIPLVGAAAGVGLAVGKLLEGDVVGAGLEAASGLGGPLTAIPAFVASVARDIYQGAYGIPPEQDPEFSSRFPEVESAVKEAVGEQLQEKVNAKEGPTGQQAQAAAPPPPLESQQNAQQAQQVSSPTISSQGATPPAGGGGSPPSGGGGAAPAPDAGGGGAAPPAAPPPTSDAGGSVATKEDTTAQSVVEQTPISNIPPLDPNAAAKMPPQTNSGQQIAAASETNAGLADQGVQATFEGTNVPKPATKLTNKNGAKGMGDVPDPNYYGMEDIPNQLYFKAVA